MARGRAKLDWDQTSLLWCLLANVNRNTQEKKEPFLPSDVHPWRTADEYQRTDHAQPDVGLINNIKRSYKVTRIKHGVKSDRSGKGISQAPRR